MIAVAARMVSRLAASRYAWTSPADCIRARSSRSAKGTIAGASRIAQTARNSRDFQRMVQNALTVTRGRRVLSRSGRSMEDILELPSELREQPLHRAPDVLLEVPLVDRTE